MPSSYVVTMANAGDQLYGPGSHAYAVEDTGGFHSTSYASENAYGAIYEHNTSGSTFRDGVTEYRSGTYYDYGAGADRFEASRVYTSDSYGGSGIGGYDSYNLYGDANPAGKATETSYTTRDASYSGDIEHLTTTSQSSIDYVDGSNLSTSSSLTETLSGGQVLYGSYAEYTLSSETAYGGGYGIYSSSEVMR